MTDPDSILDFWFEGVDDSQTFDGQKPPFKKWFTKDVNFDSEIRGKFESELEKASRGEYEAWADSPKSRLALIILFDQFSRNIYRNSPKMFATDPLALELTLKSMDDGTDRQLQVIERKFLYMPLMHSEGLAIQQRSVDSFASLIEQARAVNPVNVPFLENTLDFARRHYAIIKRFGRFPHRNAILNRASTPEENDFLKEEGSSF